VIDESEQRRACELLEELAPGRFRLDGLIAEFNERAGFESIVDERLRELCRRTRERDRVCVRRLCRSEEAAAQPDGPVGIGGSTLSRTPMAMIWALIRAGRGISCARSITSSEGSCCSPPGRVGTS
jgi:hypothetical protein